MTKIYDFVVKWQVLRIPVVEVEVDNSISPVCYLFFTYSHWFILTYDDVYKRFSCQNDKVYGLCF